MLTQRQLQALRNLGEKGGGVLTPFLNIADAQALTNLGLASRSRQGWDLTKAGFACLEKLGSGPAAAAHSPARDS